jgi:hypothetical protein
MRRGVVSTQLRVAKSRFVTAPDRGLIAGLSLRDIPARLRAHAHDRLYAQRRRPECRGH